jgi:3-hydroxybutyryl-CoA dehydrogenase
MTSVAILGAGTMGRGIAYVAALGGAQVLLYDTQSQALEAALLTLREALEREVSKGRLEAVEPVLERIRTTQDLSACQEADWIIEAIPEDLALKQELYRKLHPRGILATNTSTFPIAALASSLEHPERFLGLHFFNPPARLRLVEVIPSGATDPGLVEEALRLLRGWGMEPIVVLDRPGFLVNRVARPFYLEALRLHGEGYPLEAIDWAIRGLGFPMGPFELMDFIGLDVNWAASRSVFEGFFFEPRFRPHPLQAEKVALGLLGRKRGAGWYTYPPGPPPPPAPPEPRAVSALPWILGTHPLARELRERFQHAERLEEASWILDARVSLGGKEELPGELPTVSLVWGHSASQLVRLHPKRPVAGLSLIPPLRPGSFAELYIPHSGRNRAVELAEDYFSAHGHPTLTLADQPGGIAFRILALIIQEALQAAIERVAHPDDLDRAMRLGTGYPRGPLEWAELLGLQPLFEGLQGLWAELGEERFRPHPWLARQVAAAQGELKADLAGMFPRRSAH